jgi:ABC-2 type transport system permease protein
MTTVGRALPNPSPWGRFYGFGSVFAKTIRDSRRATLVAAAFLVVVFLGVSKAIVTEFDTPESRAEMDALIRQVPPILQGLAGKVVNVGTLGGYLQYKYGFFFPLVISFWSILALSSTLAGEASRGSLEFVLAAATSRRRIALEKVAGHVFMLSLACLAAFVSIAVAGAVYPVLPGDEISPLAAFGYAVQLLVIALCGGGLSFALAPFVGRGGAAGIAGFVTAGGFIVNGYQQPVPELAPFANLTWWGWTQNHVPLAGVYDWPAVGFAAAVALVLLTVGVEAFQRWDVGVTTAIPGPSMPGPLLGLAGPVSRAAGQNLARAVAWGLGVGFFGLVFGAAAGGFLDALAASPRFVELLSTVFPGIDYASAGGFLQLLFIELGVVFAGLAAATIVSGWAADETTGRLGMLLATPLGRVRWAIASGIGMLVDVGAFTVLTAAGIGIGVAVAGAEIATPVAGSLVLGVYAAALVGIGVAVGGLVGARSATPAVVGYVLVAWFVQLFGEVLHLPGFIRDLALATHLGQTMVGVWDPLGIAAAVLVTVGGIAVGAWGVARRDLMV